ncbi:serine/threonine-protein kinase pim-3-like [Oratosquilla oratoria]|uniref:serine/threonine-protein kinase pim-3-like n=1 Tax=Oratosquilla oratoria TaxID=337810 RepID=UPI003F7649C3
MTKLNEFEVQELLGKGGIGSVYRAKRIIDGQEVALKKVPLARMKSYRRRNGKRIPKEAALLKKVQKVPGVIKLYDYFIANDNFYMVMELIPSSMSLYDYIENDNDLSNVEVRRLFKNIVTTIKGCFEAAVSHKDIKPENILLFRDKSSGQLDIKVIDFGCGERITSYKGTDTGGTRIY